MIKTVKFNLKAALKNPERVIYRNGEKPKEWHWFKCHESMYNVQSVNNNGFLLTHTESGHFISERKPNKYDLLLIADDKKTK